MAECLSGHLAQRVLTFHTGSRCYLSSRCRLVLSGDLYGNCTRQQRENNPVSRCLHVKRCYRHQARRAPTAWAENTLTAVRSATGPFSVTQRTATSSFPCEVRLCLLMSLMVCMARTEKKKKPQPAVLDLQQDPSAVHIRLVCKQQFINAWKSTIPAVRTCSCFHQAVRLWYRTHPPWEVPFHRVQ